jgi:hypothetical protein
MVSWPLRCCWPRSATPAAPRRLRGRADGKPPGLNQPAANVRSQWRYQPYSVTVKAVRIPIL